MSGLAILICDFCGVEASETAKQLTTLRARLCGPDRPDAARWERMGHRDCCPACRRTPDAQRVRTRAVNWLITHDDRVIGHAVNRAQAVRAIQKSYGGSYWPGGISAKERDRSGFPNFRVWSADSPGPEFLVECPDGVVLRLVSRAVAEGYVDLCPCGREAHYEADRAPRNPIRCWIGLAEPHEEGLYGFFLDGWHRPLESSDDVQELLDFAVERRYEVPEVRVSWAGRHLRALNPEG